VAFVAAMAIFRTEAIVLKTQNYRETSKILTLYTPNQGRLKVIAKGVRSLSSKFSGILDLLNHLQIVYYYKETRDIQLLSHADLIRAFPVLRGDLRRLPWALAICELVDRTQFGQEANSAFFRLLVESLSGMEEASSPQGLYFAFLMRFFDLSGIRPRLDRCRKCGLQPPTTRSYFQIKEGGYLCENCVTSKDAGLILSPEALHILRRLQQMPLRAARNLHPSQRAEGELHRLFFHFLCHHFEGFEGLKALQFIQKMETADIKA